MNFDWLIHYLECPNVLANNNTLRQGIFVYHDWEFITIYPSLSYPLRSLNEYGLQNTLYTLEAFSVGTYMSLIVAFEVVPMINNV